MVMPSGEIHIILRASSATPLWAALQKRKLYDCRLYDPATGNEYRAQVDSADIYQSKKAAFHAVLKNNLPDAGDDLLMKIRSRSRSGKSRGGLKWV